MAIQEKVIYVYESWSDTEPLLMGILYINSIRGTEAFSFEYNSEWLNKHKSSQFMLDPNLDFYDGRQYTNNQELFGIFSDSCPDRWGQVLMKRREAVQARKEERKPKKLTKSDFLLGVYDETRMGALRFKLKKNGVFVSDDEKGAIPPWTTLRKLEEASRGFEIGNDKEEEKWIKQLIKPGSSLGGARPKATVKDVEGNLWIAKFPSTHDENDTGAWEKVVSDLARLCNLNVPQTKCIKFSSFGHTFLTKRFDRDKEKRIHFSSAMTLLGKVDGASAEDGSSYLDIVDFIKSYGAKPNEDIEELWKRIIFNMAVSNTDDHLRNHGFLLTEKGWVLSPLYDVNPIPYGEGLSLNVTDTDNSIHIDTLLEFAVFIDKDKKEAIEEINFICTTVKNNWKALAKQNNISRDSINKMQPAFYFADKL